MSGYGANGFMQGLMQGAEVGDHLANRVAQFRAGHRMSALQDKIDAGAYDPKNFGGDSAAAQKQLQIDTRNAQAPLSGRGLDVEFGSDQYDRLSALQQMRANQQGGAMMNHGDLAGGMQTSANASAALGNLPAALQSGQLAGQMRAGANATKPTGPGGALEVDDAQLSRDVSTNSAKYGDVSGSASWVDQAKVRAQAAVNGMLGRAITVAQNPQLGGMEAAVPLLHAAGQLSGYGDVQWSPSEGKAYLVDKTGKPISAIGPQDISQFAQTIGRDPEQILPTIQKMHEEAYSSQLKGAESDREAARDAKLGIVRDAATERLRAYLAAKLGGRGGSAHPKGLQIDGATKMPITDADGNVTGYQYVATAPNSSQPVVVTVHGTRADDIGHGTPVTVTDLQGNPLDLDGNGGGLPQATAPAGPALRPLPGQQVAAPPALSPQSMNDGRNAMGLPPPSTFFLR